MNSLNHDEQNKIQFIKAYNSCMRFLTPRARSVKETKNYMEKRKFTSKVIDKTINRLLKEHLLDDKIFAHMFVENRERFRPRSKFALSFELRQKGIDDSVIECAVRDIDEFKSAWSAVKPKLGTWKSLDSEKFKRKILNYLKNRGFSYEISSATLGRCLRHLNGSKQN